MEFTKEQKNEYLDELALATQKDIWMSELAKLKNSEKLAKKKALLTVVEQKIEQKEYKSARDGKNEKTQLETDIANLESKIQEGDATIGLANADLELIEEYRQK
ncbi:hypothetical protein BH10ACI1_BH10ACI1_02600 [soil metagenome]